MGLASKYAGVETLVLRRVDVAEAFAAYANGDRLYDVAGARHAFAPVASTDLGPRCLADPQVFEDRFLREVHDDQVRAFDNGVARRGSAIRYWATLEASTYRYLFEYGFREDLSLTCRLGATGHNAFPRKPDGRDAHLHVGCWRLEFDLGGPADLVVETVELDIDSNGRTSLNATEFNGGREGGGKWNAERFTRLRVRRRTPSPAQTLVGYDLVPTRWGTARALGGDDAAFANDFWVTRGLPESANRWAPELAYRDVAWCAAHAEPLEGHAPVVWVQSGFAHVPRGEDFGRVGDDNAQGVAVTMWAGVTLMPVWTR